MVAEKTEDMAKKKGKVNGCPKGIGWEKKKVTELPKGHMLMGPKKKKPWNGYWIFCLFILCSGFWKWCEIHIDYCDDSAE